MLQTQHQLPDLSVDFMSWLNSELRQRIEGKKSAEKKHSLVNRLKAYFQPPVVAERSAR